MTDYRDLHDGCKPWLKVQTSSTRESTDTRRPVHQLPPRQEQGLRSRARREPSNVGRVSPHGPRNGPGYLDDQTTPSFCHSPNLGEGADAVAYVFEHILEQHSLKRVGPEGEGGSVGDNAHLPSPGVRSNVVHVDNGLARGGTSSVASPHVENETVVQTAEERR